MANLYDGDVFTTQCTCCFSCAETWLPYPAEPRPTPTRRCDGCDAFCFFESPRAPLVWMMPPDKPQQSAYLRTSPKPWQPLQPKMIRVDHGVAVVFLLMLLAAVRLGGYGWSTTQEDPASANMQAGNLPIVKPELTTSTTPDPPAQYELALPTYAIGSTEITNAQFRPFVEDDGYTNSTGRRRVSPDPTLRNTVSRYNCESL